MGNLVKYGSYDISTADEEAKAVGTSDYLKLEVGKNRVRILPPPVPCPWAKKPSPFFITHQHNVPTPTQSYGNRFACLRLMQGKFCPACVRSDELLRSGNVADRELAWEIGAQVKVYCNVIDRKNLEAGPKVWEFGKKMHGFLKAVRKNEDAGGDFCDPLTGFDIVIERVGTGKMDTKYMPMPARNSTKLSDSAEQMNEWISGQRDLNRFLVVKRHEDIAKFFGVSGGDEEGDAPAPRRATRTAVDDMGDAAEPLDE